MTDKELLELAAKAAGVDVPKSLWADYTGQGLKLYSGIIWNPLINDEDAFKLCVKLKMAVRVFEHISDAHPLGFDTDATTENHSGDDVSATRRAIVRAAAEIGKSL